MKIWRNIANALFGGTPEREVPPFPGAELGDGCALALETESLKSLELRLASAFQSTFMEHVRGRIMAAKPELSDAAYDWGLFELRRFFLMTAICKEQVPMYSETADTIWHEMLLFTREYESFCRSFAGRIINHEPHLEKPSRIAAYKQRVEFELIYGALFRLYPMNERLLGAFRKHYFSEEQIALLERMDAEAFREQWFRDELEAAADVARKLAGSVQEGAAEARRRGSRISDSTLSGDYAAWLIAASISQDHSRKADGSSGSGYHGGPGGKHDGDGGGDGGSSGGGSSCGGSCGSS